MQRDQFCAPVNADPFNTRLEFEHRYEELRWKFDGFDFEFLKEYEVSGYNSKLIKDMNVEEKLRKGNV